MAAACRRVRTSDDDDDEDGRGGKQGHFYGIPQVSLKIIYIIDVSGSMKQDVGGKSRLEACQGGVVERDLAAAAARHVRRDPLPPDG